MTLAVEAVAVAMYLHQTDTRYARWNWALTSPKEGTGPRHAFPLQWGVFSPLPSGIASNEGRTPFFLTCLVAWDSSGGGAGSLNPRGHGKHTKLLLPGCIPYPLAVASHPSLSLPRMVVALLCSQDKKHLDLPFRARREASLSSAGWDIYVWGLRHTFLPSFCLGCQWSVLWQPRMSSCPGQCKERWCLSQAEGFCRSGQKHGALTFPDTTVPLSQG